MQIEPGVLDDLKFDQGALLDVSDDFAKLRRGTRILITGFFAQRESSLGKIVARDYIQVNPRVLLEKARPI